MSVQLKIDIVSDVTCPWCIIGYKSLVQALDKLHPSVTARIAWKPFELNPKMGAEGQHLGEHLHEKYGSSDADTAQARNMITARGAALGFTFNFKDDGRICNTFNAHRLLYWARQFDQQTQLKLALFELYFTQAGNPSNKEELLKAVAKTTLSQAEARKILDSEQYVNEVREEQKKYIDLGIKSVPTFIINDKYKITGGQPVDEFVATLSKIISEESTIKN
jgi:predicted DsbA family dithiol-disulfide isomerase